jgi:Protein kinase domain/Caspase domain
MPLADLPPVPDRYEPLAEVAATPFERTLLARDRVLGREVLLKVPDQATGASWTAPVRERLLREARALASVRHPAVMAVLDVLATAAGPILVLEVPTGELLADRLQHGPLDLDRACAIAIDVAEALAALHYQGHVHRAVGPAAVYVATDGRARLGAFTFAKEFGASMGSSIGHADAGFAAPRHLPPYPAPEQLAGKPADPRSDVFALGCLLWRCLVGEDPADVAVGGAGDLRQRRRDVPADLAEIVRRCLAVAPAARYQTAHAVAEALRAARRPPAQRGRLWPLLAGSAALLAVAAAVWAWLPDRDPEWRSGASLPPVRSELGDTYAACHALLVGIDDYAGGWSDLPNAGRDVDAVAAQLVRNDPRWRDGIRRVPAREATRRRLIEELLQLRDPARIGSEDAVLVYFAGHGCCVDPQSLQYWLVGVDAAATDPRTDAAGFVPALEIHDLLRNCPAKHVLVVLDTCFGARVFGADRGEPLLAPRPATDGRRDPLLRHRARQILVSSGADAPASDGVSGLSPFCRAFVAAITPPQPGPVAISTWEVFADIARAMRQRGGGWQLPVLRSEAGPEGSFVFFAGGR